MANIYNNESISLQAVEYGGIEPYVSCIQWRGYTGGVTAHAFPVSSSTATSNTPCIVTSNGGCASGTGIGALTGTFVTNGYTGTVTMWIETTDALGCTAASNFKNYTVMPSTNINVYAGPDVSVTSSTYIITGATISGGTPSYTYHWTTDSPSVTIGNSGTSTPSISGMTTNGSYYLTLYGTDSGGHTGLDDMIITRSGAAIPLTVTGSFTQSVFSAGVSGGIPPFNYLIHDEVGFITYDPANYTTASRLISGFTMVDGAPGVSGTAHWSVEVTDSSIPQRSGYKGGSYHYLVSCFLKGTNITMADGSTQVIENLNVGDSLLSNNTGASEQWGLYSSSNPDLRNISTKIISISQHIVDSYYKINGGMLSVTAEHPIFVYNPLKDLYTFKVTKNLAVGDVLINGVDQSKITIETIEKINENSEVYKMNVTPSNTFIANQIIVHSVKHV